MEPFIGQIAQFAFDFPPQGWAFCNGQMLPIAQYSPLYSLLGIKYGGDGVTTFALPDFRGRVSIGFGRGPGLSETYIIGDKGGYDAVTLTAMEMPMHSHVMRCASTATTDSPVNAVPATLSEGSGQVTLQGYAPSPGSSMAPTVIQPAGGTDSHENRQPYLAVNWCIALYGIYPSRSN